MWSTKWNNLRKLIVGEIEVLPCNVEKLVKPEGAKPISALMMTYELPFVEKV